MVRSMRLRSRRTCSVGRWGAAGATLPNVRSLVLLGLAALIGCSPVFSIGVDDFSVPIANTLGQICWVRIDASGAPNVRTATYSAKAAYDAGLVGVTDSVRVQFYGRAEEPAGSCTSRDERADEQLSPVFELKSEAQTVVVGGASYGHTLGTLASAGVFWLGASAQGNVGIGEQLHFSQGHLSVGF